MATGIENANGDVKTKSSSRKNMKFLQPVSPDAPPNLKRASSRYITVEPVVILIGIGAAIMVVMLPQFLRRRIAMERNVTLPDADAGNGTCVKQNINNPYYVRLQEIQAEVAYWQMIHSLAGTLPALFVSPFLGAWSDIVGRKVVLGLIACGFTCYVSGFILTFHFMLPIWVIPVSYSFAGLTGGIGLLMAQAFAYLSDVTNKETRLLRIAALQGIQFTMIGVAQISIGYLIRDYGFGPPLWMAGIAIFLALLYIVIPPLLIETVNTSGEYNKQRTDGSGFSFTDNFKGLTLLFKNNTSLRRCRLSLLYLIDFMREILEKSFPIVFLYGLGPPFCWSSVLLSGYTLVIIFGGAIARGLAPKALSLCLPDLWTLQSSMVFNIAYGYLHAFATSTMGLYIAGFVGCFRNISQPLVPAMLAKMVSDHEHGVVFAFEASIQNIGSLISPVLLNSIYRKTVQTQPNFVFIMLGTLGFIPFILTTVLQVINRYTKRNEPQATESIENPRIENKGLVAMDEMGTE